MMRRASWLLALLLSGCAAGPPPETVVGGLTLPVRDPTPRPLDDDDPRETPPATEPRATPVLPSPQHQRLPSGVELVTVARKGSPRVELRLVMKGAGTDADGDTPGLAALALRLCLEGGTLRLSGKDVSGRLAALGVTLSWALRRDAAVISASMPGASVKEALALLLQTLREPRLDAVELGRARRLERGATPSFHLPERWLPEIERRELLQGAAAGSVEATLDRASALDLRAFARRHLGPQALTVILVGEIDDTLRDALDKGTAAWKTTTTPAPPRPLAPRRERHRILLLDRPQAAAVELWLLAPGPAMHSEGGAAFALLAEILGGAPTTRLPLALQSSPPLAATARMELLQRGPQALLHLQATVEASRAVAALGVLIDTIRKAPEAPGEAELQGAKGRALTSQRQLHEAPHALADELARQAALGVPGASQRWQGQLQDAEASQLQEAAQAHLGGGLLVVVAGSAAQLTAGLQRLGDVAVVSLEKGFEVGPTLPETKASPGAEGR
jgi:predicted Zn-dependent peptidase